MAEELEILSRLFNEGALTAEEFTRGKERVLEDDDGGHQGRNLDEAIRALTEVLRERQGPSDRRALQEESPSLADKLGDTSLWLKGERAKVALGPAADVSFGRENGDEDGSDPHLVVRGALRVEGDLRTGRLQVGADASACTDALQGSIKWVAAEKKMMACGDFNGEAKWLNVKLESIARQSCLEILTADPTSASGPYTIKSEGCGDPYTVYCDMATSGGGWTLVARLMNPSSSFTDPNENNPPTNSYGTNVNAGASGTLGHCKPVMILQRTFHD